MCMCHHRHCFLVGLLHSTEKFNKICIRSQRKLTNPCLILNTKTKVSHWQGRISRLNAKGEFLSSEPCVYTFGHDSYLIHRDLEILHLTLFAKANLSLLNLKYDESCGRKTRDASEGWTVFIIWLILTVQMSKKCKIYPPTRFQTSSQKRLVILGEANEILVITLETTAFR